MVVASLKEWHDSFALFSAPLKEKDYLIMLIGFSRVYKNPNHSEGLLSESAICGYHISCERSELNSHGAPSTKRNCIEAAAGGVGGITLLLILNPG